MYGRDETTAFLPLDFRIGGQNRDSYPTIGHYLARDQTRYIYSVWKHTARCKHLMLDH